MTNKLFLEYQRTKGEMKLINAGLLLLGGTITFVIGAMFERALIRLENVSSIPAYMIMIIGAVIIAYSVVLIMRTFKR